MLNFEIRYTKALVILCILAVIFIGLSFVLPIEYSYENSIIIYILMIGRELSWGRVFYPIGMDKNGEQIFVKVHELWYGSVVYPMVGILILIVLILLGVYFYQSRRQGIYWYIPLGEFLFFIVTSILGQCVFDRGLVQFGNYNQLLEESCEIIAYIALVCCTYDISFKRRYIHIRYFSIR